MFVKKSLHIRKIIAFVTYSITALVSMLLGLVYLFRSEFMPYHSEALALNWNALDANLRVLLKALMMVAGAGWTALGLTLFLLLFIPFRLNQNWSGYAIPALILVFYIPTLIATLTVLYNTPATPPWYGNLISCVTAIIAFLVFHPNQMNKMKHHE